jgi:hypothetical protein
MPARFSAPSSSRATRPVERYRFDHTAQLVAVRIENVETLTTRKVEDWLRDATAGRLAHIPALETLLRRLNPCLEQIGHTRRERVRPLLALLVRNSLESGVNSMTADS